MVRQFVIFDIEGMKVSHYANNVASLLHYIQLTARMILLSDKVNKFSII